MNQNVLTISIMSLLEFRSLHEFRSLSLQEFRILHEFRNLNEFRSSLTDTVNEANTVSLLKRRFVDCERSTELQYPN